MTMQHDGGIDRRQFLKQTGLAAVVSSFAWQDAKAQAAEDSPNTHNMLVVGQRTIFLSHLPMFLALNQAKTAFRSPHRAQVILEATFTNAGKEVSDLYLKDRQAHPERRIYTLSPKPFVLSRLFTPQQQPGQSTFTAEVFRGHLEQPDHNTISGLEQTLVTVKRVVHGRIFEPQAKKPAKLEYILFGNGSELYLAHAIFAPPDFDHVLSVKLAGQVLTDRDLRQDMRVVISDRKNVPAERLREKQRAPATLRIGAGSATSNIQVEVDGEFYFEEGELRVPPTFEPTVEEKKAEKKDP